MRFFFIFLIFYFYAIYVFEKSYSIFDYNENGVDFSNSIRLKISKIPHKNNTIIRKFDISHYNFKNRPIAKNKNLDINTDSKSIIVSTRKPILIKSKMAINLNMYKTIIF